jgi:class 3 adenylate cyclase
MFPDVVGSTRLWGKDPDAMSASLRLHDALFNPTIARSGGHVFATAGDSFAAAFNEASARVECAGALQAAPSGYRAARLARRRDWRSTRPRSPASTARP